MNRSFVLPGLLAVLAASCLADEDPPLADEPALGGIDTDDGDAGLTIPEDVTAAVASPYLLTPLQYRQRFDAIIASYDAHPASRQLVWGTNDVLQAEVAAYQATGDITYLLAAFDEMETLILRTSYRTQVADYVTGTKKYVWLSTRYSCGHPVATMLGDSLIVAPMADAVYEGLRHASQFDASRVQRMGYFVLVLDAAMSFHDAEFHVDAPTAGHYLIPSYYGKITGCDAWAGLSGNLGKHMPTNMESEAGLANIAMWRLYRDIPSVRNATKALEYRTRAAQLITWVKAQMYGVGTTLQWPYWPGPNQAPDDLSHAVLTVNFMMSAYNDGLNSNYLSGLRNTFVARYSSNFALIAERMDGSGTKGLAANVQALSRWARLLRYDSTMGSRIRALYSNTTYVDPNGVHPVKQITAGAYYELFD